MDMYKVTVRDALEAQPDEMEAVEFEMEVITEGGTSSWNFQNHTEFLDAYNQYDDDLPMDEYLGKNFKEFPSEFISCLRKIHEISIAAIQPIAAPVPPVSVPFDPKDTRRLWSKEEINELHCLVKAYDNVVPKAMRKSKKMWELIFHIKNGMRTISSCKTKLKTTKAIQGEEEMGLAEEKIRKALEAAK